MDLREFLQNQIKKGNINWRSKSELVRASGNNISGNNAKIIKEYENKFQFGSEYGKLIENGKLTRTVKNPNYRGVTTPFWNNLKKVGDASTFEIHGTPNCGKGEPNQVIRVGHASPVCQFENIEVFGGE